MQLNFKNLPKQTALPLLQPLDWSSPLASSATSGSRNRPWSVNGIIKGITLWAVSALVYSAEDADFSQTISTGLTLVPPLTALGFMLGEIASTVAQFYKSGLIVSLLQHGSHTDKDIASNDPQNTAKASQGKRGTTSRDSNLANGSDDPAPAQSAKETTEAMHEDLANIIKGAKPNEHNGHQARAYPNRRLEVAFRINNCFTAMEKKRCDKVRDDVLELLQPAKPGVTGRWGDWPELVEVARTVTRSELSDSQDKVNLFAAMQMVTMKTMLKVLFDKSPEDTSKDPQIRKLAKGVDRQWQESKGRMRLGEAPEWDFEQQATLKALAEEVFSGWDEEHKDNPFNMILPDYETMWRVVMRCFLELSSTRHPAAATEAWKERLASFIANPTKSQLQKGTDSDGLTAEHISFEILRLYPPTRHVAREHKNPNTGAVRPMTADIENLHHTAPIWGNDSKSFRPERWIVLTEGVNTKGFMPFGEKPFRCPARQTRDKDIPFGVMMIAVLTGCFIEAMAGKWPLDEQGIPPASQPMGNNRDDYKGVSLLRLRPAASDLASSTADELQKRAADEITADKIDAEKTGADNIDADDTALDKAGANKAGDEAKTIDEANTSDEPKTGDETKTDADKTSDEAKMELSETNSSDGQDEEQTAATEQ